MNKLDNIIESEDFRKRYSTLSDEKIIEILKNRSDYQQNAVTAAMEIAIARGIINSEQDLFDERFRNNLQPGFKLFPIINDQFHKQRLISSIFRFLYLMSMLPVVFGLLKYSQGNINQALIGILAGLLWFCFCFLYKKTAQILFLIILIVLLFSISLVGFYLSAVAGNYIVLDIVLMTITIFVMLYLLIYSSILLKNRQKV